VSDPTETGNTVDNSASQKSRERRKITQEKRWEHEMPSETREEERLTEDDMARSKLGPRGVPGGPDTSKMTPQQEKNIPKTGRFDGHTA
jgi:hypothetical protein